MSSPIDIIRLLSQYLKSHTNPRVSYSQLLAYTERYLQQNETDNPHMEDLRRDTHRILSHHLRSLEEKGRIEIQRSEGQAVSIFFEEFFHEQIAEYYQKVLDDPQQSLANEENLKFELPEDRIQSVDIKQNFVDWLNDDSDTVRIVRLLFPSNIASLISTSALLKKEMITSSIQKVRQYLHHQRNSTYITQKLMPIFKGREVAVKDLMRLITQSPEGATRTVIEASELSFQVWTQLSTFIIKEYESKADKLEEEHNFCQAAYLIGYYCVYFKGREQKKKDQAGAIKTLVNTLKKPPYAFTISEIQALRDDKGIPLLKKFSKETLHQFIEEETTTPQGSDLPAMLNLKLPNDSNVYLYRSVMTKVLENQRLRAAKSFRDFYKNSWYSAMMDNDELNTMSDDEEFKKHVYNRLRERFPLLFSLLRFELLYLMTQEKSNPQDVKHICGQYIDTRHETVRDITDILELDRKKILSDARILLPFWMSVPILRGFVHLFRRLFLGKDFVERYHAERFDHEAQKSTRKKGKASTPIEATSKQFGTVRDGENADKVQVRAREQAQGDDVPVLSGAQTAKAQRSDFKKLVQRLEPEFLDRGKSLEMSLRELIDKWNPILDEGKRKDLVEDVNSMCRDFIRGLKISYRKPPPSANTIREMAHRLAGNDTFSRIRDKNYLEQYIQLYFLKLLGR